MCVCLCVSVCACVYFVCAHLLCVVHAFVCKCVCLCVFHLALVQIRPALSGGWYNLQNWCWLEGTQMNLEGPFGETYSLCFAIVLNSIQPLLFSLAGPSHPSQKSVYRTAIGHGSLEL